MYTPALFVCIRDVGAVERSRAVGYSRSPLRVCTYLATIQYTLTETVVLTMVKLSQLQLNDTLSLPHSVFISPILLRLNACVECVYSLQNNVCCEHVSEQPKTAGHC